MRVIAGLLFLVSITLTGCSLVSTAPSSPEAGTTLQGNVHGGQQPVVGAHVYLLAANTTGYGQPSNSLLSSAFTGHSDSIGAYVLTASNGGFSIPAGYACAPATQVYLYALGGNPGAGVNTAVGFLAVLGSCPTNGSFEGAIPSIVVNEISTVAAAYSIAGFATDATHVSSSGTPLAQTGIAHAFANAANMASLSTGTALATTPAGNGLVPRTTINTIANILASCVNSTSAASANCNTLLGTALSNGATGAIPLDTATAAINLAHHPQNGVDTLFGLPPAAPPFLPQLAVPPYDFSISIAFTGGGLRRPNSVAIDASGNVWAANASLNDGSSLSELRSDGSPLSPASGFTASCLDSAYYAYLAVEASGKVWFDDTYQPGCLTEFSSTGTSLSGNGVNSGGLSFPKAIAIDHSGNVWTTSPGTKNVSEFSSSGFPLSSPAGFSSGGGSPYSVVVDASGAVWVGDASAPTLYRYAADGSFTSYTDPAVGGFQHMSIDSSNRIWIALADEQVVNFSISMLTYSSAYDVNNFGLTAIPVITMDGASNVWLGSAGVTRFPTDGVTPSDSFRASTPLGGSGFTDLAVDGSGNLWGADEIEDTLIEFIGIAQPVVTPIATASATNRLGARP